MATDTRTAAHAAIAANRIHKPLNPSVSKTVGVTTAAMVEPKQPQIPQIPIAEPIFSGFTHFCTTIGPQVVKIVRATPSTAREKMRTALEPEATPTSDPMMAIPHATIIIRFAPNFCASQPVGNATKMLMSVKIDMSHEAAFASIANSAISSVRIVGTLYWIIATEMPAIRSTTPIITGF